MLSILLWENVPDTFRQTPPHSVPWAIARFERRLSLRVELYVIAIPFFILFTIFTFLKLLTEKYISFLNMKQYTFSKPFLSTLSQLKLI